MSKRNEKDLIDTVMMLREHSIDDSDRETINATKIASLCSVDWGLWRTTTINLDKLANYMKTFPWLEDEDKRNVSDKISNLLETIEKHPKSLKWKMRASVGESKSWYRTVEERA